MVTVVAIAEVPVMAGRMAVMVVAITMVAIVVVVVIEVEAVTIVGRL
jgi:hypothetical protein